MLKALEILRRELQNNYEKRPFVIKTELYHKERIEDFHEAIDELEALQNRSCSNCKYNKEQDGFMIFCDKEMCQDGSKMMWHSFTKDFCCNKWEVKNES
ncbi:hypothetical protein ACOTVO_04730 [Aliarcobacter butzleri]